MALHFDLKINNQSIGYFEALRVVGSADPDSVNIYQVTLAGPVGEWRGTVTHRYGDGAWDLVRKVLVAKREWDLANQE